MICIDRVSKRVLFTEIEKASDIGSRLKGLLGRRDLSSQAGLLLEPCRDIHMWGMQFPIDALFLKKRGGDHYSVLSMHTHLQPWKWLPVADWHASAVLEVAAGAVERLEIKKGMELCISSS